MRTARPAARAPHPFFEVRAQPFDMLPPCLIFLDGDGPADPLVACERRYVFPSRQCLRVGRERLSEISRETMYDSSGDLNGCHRTSRRLQDQASDTRVQLGFRDYRRLTGRFADSPPLLPGCRSLARNESNGSIGGAEVSPTQPASGLNLLFLFQGQGVDVGGRYVAKHQRRVAGVQPEP
jgi:hypothetical protein